MSEENLEITRRAYEAFNRRDFEALVAIWDPNIEWHQFTQFPDRGVYRGVEEVRDRFLKTQLVEQFGDFRIDIEELVDAGDHVVMIGFIDAHGTASGVPIRLRVVNILELRDGRLVRAYDASGPSQTMSQEAMSQGNVDLVRRMIDAGNRGDLTAWASGLHDEIVYFPLAENPQTEPLHGVAAVLDFVTDWLEPWKEYRVEVTRTMDAGDRVFVATKHSARHETGAEISMEMYIAGAVRDGRFIELRWFMNEPDALEAAGLSM